MARDELLVILDVTSTVIRAGVGVHDLIRAPAVEIPTRVGRKPESTAPYNVGDYIVGHDLYNAEIAGQVLDIVHPMTVGAHGLEVHDWLALEAVFRYVFHVSLRLPRPPLAHPCLVSIPAHLSQTLVDQIHALLFERILIPQLLIGTRPFFAAAAAGVLNAIIVDIGYRNEGSEISIVTENQVLESARIRLPGLDEGVCDDWLCLQLIEGTEGDNLIKQLSATSAADDSVETSEKNLSPAELIRALRAIVEHLKRGENLYKFESTHFKSSTLDSTRLLAEDEGNFDVAKALVEGKVDKIVNKKTETSSSTKRGKKSAEDEEEGDFITIPHPLNSELDAIKIGPSRHRYLEPLFVPHILKQLSPRHGSEKAKLLNFTEYDDKSIEYSGIQEAVGIVVGTIEDIDLKRSIWEGVVVTSSGKISNNKALGNTLIPLLSPYVIDAEAGSEAQPKSIKYARIPDYFSEYKIRAGELAVFLGGSITAKILISDLQSRLFMSKVDYSNRGPSFYRMLDKIAV